MQELGAGVIDSVQELGAGCGVSGMVDRASSGGWRGRGAGGRDGPGAGGRGGLERVVPLPNATGPSYFSLCW